MNSIQYQKLALCTKSDSYHGHYVHRQSFINKLRHLSSVAENLDVIKKGVFYGRGISKDKNSALFNSESIASDSQPMRDIIHSIVGIATESGELCERLTAIIENHHNKTLSHENLTAEDITNIYEEFGDVLWYLAIGCEALGVTLEQVMSANITKLQKRFPEKFTEEKANNRDLKNEYKSLQSSLNNTIV